MTINNQGLGSIDIALTTQDTVESAFRSALTNVAAQVDANQVNLNADRTIQVTGDVDSAVVTFNLTDVDRGVTVINTTLGTDVVDSNEIRENAVTAVELADNSVDTASIVGLAVNNSKLSLNAVTSDKLAAGQVSLSHINPGATRTLTITPPGGGAAMFTIIGFAP